MSAVAVQGRFASPIIHALIKQVILKDVLRLRHQLETLLEANQGLGNSPIGFLFGGRFHSVYDKTTQAKAPKKPIHPSLITEAQDYVDAERHLQQNVARMQAGLSLLLRPCETWQDVRDALPDVVKDELPELKELSRTRPEGWTLESFPLQRMQLQITCDLLAYHIANRLLY